MVVALYDDNNYDEIIAVYGQLVFVGQFDKRKCGGLS
jgi:hypothetical protein